MKLHSALLTIALLSAAHAFGNTGQTGSTNTVSKLEALKGQYDAVAMQAEKSFLTKSQEALIAYGKGLTTAQETLQRQGNLDAFLAVQAEKKRFDAEKTVLEPSGKPDGAEIDRLAGIYKKTLEAARADQTKSMLALKQRYAASLDRLVKELMLAKDLEQAKLANEESKRIKSELAAAQPELPEGTGKASEQTGEREATSRVPASLRQGLILHYAFDKNDRNGVSDLSGGKHTGQVHGAAYTPAGLRGGAYDFDGNGYIEISGNSADFRKTTEDSFSFAAWVNLANSASSAGCPIFSASNDYADHSESGRFVYSLYTLPDGRPQFGLGKVWTYGLGGATAAAPLSPNAWHHVVAVHSNRTARLYVDGMPSGSCTYRESLSAPMRTPILLGKALGQATMYFKGKMDEVRFYDRALSEKEVAALTKADARSGKNLLR